MPAKFAKFGSALKVNTSWRHASVATMTEVLGRECVADGRRHESRCADTRPYLRPGMGGMSHSGGEEGDRWGCHVDGELLRFL